MLLTTQEVIDRLEEYEEELYSADRQMLIIINIDNQRIEKITKEEVI